MKHDEKGLLAKVAPLFERIEKVLPSGYRMTILAWNVDGSAPDLIFTNDYTDDMADTEKAFAALREFKFVASSS